MRGPRFKSFYFLVSFIFYSAFMHDFIVTIFIYHIIFAQFYFIGAKLYMRAVQPAPMLLNQVPSFLPFPGYSLCSCEICARCPFQIEQANAVFQSVYFPHVGMPRCNPMFRKIPIISAPLVAYILAVVILLLLNTYYYDNNYVTSGGTAYFPANVPTYNSSSKRLIACMLGSRNKRS